MEDRYLFRAKRIDNGEWAQGSLICEPWGMTIQYLCIVDGRRCKAKVDPASICQCTGLRDKTGKLIWENDIIKETDGVRGIIRFGRYGDEATDYGFYIEWEKTQPYWRNDICFWQRLREIKVIGSKFDNPELLEVQECQEELKTCPFCGNENIETGTDIFTGRYSFTCNRCKYTIKRKEKCIEMWNRRANDEVD